MGRLIEFGLLGTLEVRADDGLVTLGRPKERALLAVLLLHANRVVSRERLIDALWGEAPPETAGKALQGYVSQLRKLLPSEMLLTRSPGYVLEVEPEAVDLFRAEKLVARSRGADPEQAANLLRAALSLWRGLPLAEFGEEPFAQTEARRIEDLRLVALEERIEADLALGRDAELVGELELLIAEHAQRERLRGQLMLALYRSGRQAEALDAYRQTQAALGKIGLEPGAALRSLERQILVQDAALDAARGPLLASAPVTLPGALVPTPAFPFVGRTEDLAVLRTLLERAEGGEGGLVLLAAEAGGGKTRLVRELAHEAAARGALVLYGASDAAVSTPYQPLREWLEFLLRACAPEALVECIGDAGEQLSRLVTGLARLMDIPAGPPAAPVGPESERYALQGAAVELLSRASRLQPLVVVVDDLHWTDVETLHLLRRLARTAPERRLLVVAAYRDRGEQLGPAFSDALADLSRLDGVTRIALGRLSEDDVRAFIRASTNADELGGLASAIGELTGGTPLLVCELWRDLRESGALEVSGAGVKLDRPLAELRGPERLRDVVRQRLAHLAPGTAATLELAAVAGPRFELRLLADAAELDQPAIAGAVEEATRHGILELLPDPPPACRFTHELVRRAVYDRVTGIQRAELHLRVGEALERVHAADPESVLPELAHHFTLAAPVAGVERAVDYNLRAGHAAIAAVAFEEAAARLASALELGIDDPRERARIQIELAHLLHETGRVTEADSMLAASLHAATGLQERGIAARALVDRLGHRSADPTLDSREMQRAAESAIDVLRQLGDSRSLAVAGQHLGISLQRQSRVADSVVALEGALVDADASGDAATRRRVINALAFSMSRGPTPVDVAIERMEQLRASSGHDRVLEASTRRFLAVLTAMAGRFDDAREHLRTSSLVLDGLGPHIADWVYRTTAAETRELLGDDDGAEQELVSTWRTFREFGGDAIDERARIAASTLAVFYCDRDRWDDAEACLAYGRETPVAWATSAALQPSVEARLAARRGRFAEALALAERAVAIAEPGDYLSLRARTWLALAEVRRARGEPGDADAAVAEAIRLYRAKGNVAAAARLLAGPAPVT